MRVKTGVSYGKTRACLLFRLQRMRLVSQALIERLSTELRRAEWGLHLNEWSGPDTSSVSSDLLSNNVMVQLSLAITWSG
jgi:hypothetical protein